MTPPPDQRIQSYPLGSKQFMTCGHGSTSSRTVLNVIIDDIIIIVRAITSGTRLDKQAYPSHSPCSLRVRSNRG